MLVGCRVEGFIFPFRAPKGRAFQLGSWEQSLLGMRLRV